MEAIGTTASAPTAPSRWQRFTRALTPAEWRRAAGFTSAVVLLHVVGFGLLIAFVAPQHFHLGDGGIFGVGLGLTAYTLGLRHAFDADHIGAIDNTTRKLQTDGQRPLGVGFFFSLGHSTVVVVLAILISIGIKGLTGAVSDDASELHTVTGVIGPSVSGLFLWIIGVLNLLVLISIIRIFRRMRRGDFDERELEHELDNRGFMIRFYKNATNAITKSWQMYPLGFLFGLGFDTATEIALLATAGAAAAGGLPFYAIVALPILFAAGMCLMDTLDGAFMNFAYGWAFAQPIRKIFYNITVTSLSVIVALVIGTIELVGVFSDRFSLTGQPWDFVNSLNLDYVGYVIVGLFVVTWIMALSIWHFGKIEQKWAAGMKRTLGVPLRRE
jgi:high-affinity nickel-transport protein